MSPRFALLALVVFLCSSSLDAQLTVAGRWRATVLAPDNPALELTLELAAAGTTVSGRVLDFPIRDGRIDGSTVTFAIAPGSQSISFTGQVSENEILFKVTGLTPVPVQFVAVRDATAEITGSVSDAAVVGALLKQFNVPGVSIAVINDFKIVGTYSYGIADVETGARVTPETMFQAASISKPVAAMVSLKAVHDGRFGLDQDINTILKSWKLPVGMLTLDRAVTPRTLMSHTSGAGDGFGFPGYDPAVSLPTIPQILDGTPPSNLRAVRLERAPMSGYEYSGGAVMIQQLALEDALGRPFAQIAADSVLRPIGMTTSTYEQPLPANRHAQAARAHGRSGQRLGPPWHVYPEQAAAGLWTTAGDLARFAIELQLAVAGKSGRVLPQHLAREMVLPVGVGPYAVGFSVSKQGEGWYFNHGGSNWGFQCDLVAHVTKGYGLVLMTNGDNGGALMNRLRRMIQQEYKWDALDRPIARSYGPT